MGPIGFRLDISEKQILKITQPLNSDSAGGGAEGEGAKKDGRRGSNLTGLQSACCFSVTRVD